MRLAGYTYYWIPLIQFERGWEQLMKQRVIFDQGGSDQSKVRVSLLRALCSLTDQTGEMLEFFFHPLIRVNIDSRAGVHFSLAAASRS